MQAALVGITLCVAAVAVPPAAWGLSGALFLSWLVLNHGYAKALRRRDRVWDRARGDRDVTIQVLVVAVSGSSVAVDVVASNVRLLESDRLAVGVTALAVFWLSVYISSLVDWYFIRARRDGAVGLPPCRSSGEVGWIRVTRIWYAHRALSVFGCLVSAVVAWTAFGLEAVDPPDARATPLFALVVTGAVAGIGLVRLFFGHLRSIAAAVASCWLSPPDIALGDRLVGPEAFRGGFVRDVALDQITVTLLDENGRPLFGPDDRARIKRHDLVGVLENSEVAGEAMSGCGRGPCLSFNEHCHWSGGDDPQKVTKRTPSRFLVL